MKKLILLTPLLFVTACEETPQTHYILYAEQEQGIDPFQTRIFVNKQYIRFDDGEGSPNYVVMDRANKKIYSVNHENQTVMILEKKDHSVTSPIELKHDVKIVGDMQQAPEILGIKPAHYQLSTNEQVCVDIVAVEGLMPVAVQAFKEFHTILATDSATTIENLPADLQDPCTLAMSTFEPTRHLDYGFPIQEWKPGYSRSLMDFKQSYDVAADTFTVPADYFSYTVQEYREGRVDLKNRKVVVD